MLHQPFTQTILEHRQRLKLCFWLFTVPGSVRKKSYLKVKNNKLWKKMTFFSIIGALIELRLQNQIERIILVIKPTFFVCIRHILENKNITSSGCYHGFSVNFRFFGHFRLPVMTVTPPRFQPFSMPSKNFGLISCLGRPWWSAPIFLNEKQLVC